MLQSPHAQGQEGIYNTKSQHQKGGRMAHLLSIIDKILIARLGVTMEIIASQC